MASVQHMLSRRPWKLPVFGKRKPQRLGFFFHETTWSGAPLQLFHLIVWLKARGLELTAAVPKPFTPESGPITDRLGRIGVEILPIIELSSDPDFPALEALCARCDAIVANTLVMWAPVQAAFETGVATIWYLHESMVARQLIAQIPEIQRTFSLPQVLAVPTSKTAQIYQPHVSRPIEVVPYGIPAIEIAPAIHRSEKVSFLLLGSYEHRKGQDVFLEAIRRLPPYLREKGRFRMAGRRLDPRYHEQLVRSGADLPELELAGALEHDQAQAAIASSDVLVCASRDETMPLVILEAMSLAKTIVTVDVGGISEWLRDGANASVVRPEDPAALARALQRCLEDSDLRQRLGPAAQRTFRRHFSLERLGRKFSQLLLTAHRAKNR